jgi:L-ascorbate metabolism protein UlaG (beta-lactamase superfamily)
MTRCVLGISATVMILAAITLRGQPELSARFIGNMAWAITDGSLTLMSDFPYDSGVVDGYMTYDAPSELRSATAHTLSLITHRHADHWSPTLFARTDWRIVAPPDATAGVPRERVVPVSRRFPYGPLRIDTFDTPHAGIGHYSYVVTWHGRRLYFSGDTEDAAHLIALRDLDVAFVSPWLHRSVSKAGARIDAKRVIIYHHAPREQVPDCSATCYVPRQGETLRF